MYIYIDRGYMHIYAPWVYIPVYTHKLYVILFTYARGSFTTHVIRKRITHLQDGPSRRRPRSTKLSLSHEKLHLTHTWHTQKTHLVRSQCSYWKCASERTRGAAKWGIRWQRRPLLWRRQRWRAPAPCMTRQVFTCIGRQQQTAIVNAQREKNLVRPEGVNAYAIYREEINSNVCVTMIWICLSKCHIVLLTREHSSWKCDEKRLCIYLIRLAQRFREKRVWIGEIHDMYLCILCFVIGYQS